MAARNSEFFRDFDHPWVRAISFCDIGALELLNKVAKRHPPRQQQGRESAWVFDLDSTLFCVGPRTRNIFFEFVRQHPRPPRHWQRALERLDPSCQRYDIEATFRMIFDEWDHENAARWAAELWAEFRSFWEQHFFIDRHLHYDRPYSRAAEYLHRIRSKGYGIVYLTGRDRPRSGLGTLHALKRAGFPLDEACHLFMKASREEGDLKYKHKASSVLGSRFEVPVFVDNEPENLVMFAEQFPRAEIVFFHSVMSQRLPLRDFVGVLNGREPWRLNSYEA
jgi:hypothetical protein